MLIHFRQHARVLVAQENRHGECVEPLFERASRPGMPQSIKRISRGDRYGLPLEKLALAGATESGFLFNTTAPISPIRLRAGASIRSIKADHFGPVAKLRLPDASTDSPERALDRVVGPRLTAGVAKQ